MLIQIAFYLYGRNNRLRIYNIFSLVRFFFGKALCVLSVYQNKKK